MKTLLTSLFFLQFFLGGVALVHAQEAESSVEAVLEAEAVTNAELGVQEPGVLPNSPLYFFKEFGRGLQRAFTFSAAAKTELELKIASEKAAEAKEVAEKDSSDEKGIERALLNYKQAQERLRSRLARLGESSQNPNVDTLLDKVAQRIIAHEKLFAELQAKHAEHKDTLDDIKNGVDETIEGVAVKDTADKFRERLENAFEQGKGSTLKHLRSIEILDRLQESDQIPEEAKEKLEELRVKLSERAGESIERFAQEGEVGADRLRNALRQLPGDVLKRTVILGEIRARVSERAANILDEVRKSNEQAPDVPPKPTACPKLESVLYQFSVARDPVSFARERGVDYKDGLVRVVINLNKADAALALKYHLQVERRVGLQIGAMAPLASLCALSEESAVDFVHLPAKPILFEPTSEPVFCTQQYDPVCGADGKTYSNRCVAELQNKVRAVHEGACEITPPPPTPTPIPIPTPTPTPVPTPVTPSVQEITLEADDAGFYPSSEIKVTKGSTVKLTFLVRTSGVYYAGLDFKSPEFTTSRIDPGSSTTVEFTADESFEFKSYWPSTGVLKATGRVIVE